MSSTFPYLLIPSTVTHDMERNIHISIQSSPTMKLNPDILQHQQSYFNLLSRRWQRTPLDVESPFVTIKNAIQIENTFRETNQNDTDNTTCAIAVGRLVLFITKNAVNSLLNFCSLIHRNSSFDHLFTSAIKANRSSVRTANRTTVKTSNRDSK